MAPDPGTEEEIRRYQAEYARKPDGLAFARLADAYRKSGALERALELLDQGLRRHPGYLSAHIVRARTLEELGEEEPAVETYRRVLDLDPQSLVALGALGRICLERGRLAEAVSTYRRLREVDPLDEGARARLLQAERELAREGELAEPEEPAVEAPASWEPPPSSPLEPAGVSGEVGGGGSSAGAGVRGEAEAPVPSDGASRPEEASDPGGGNSGDEAPGEGPDRAVAVPDRETDSASEESGPGEEGKREQGPSEAGAGEAGEGGEEDLVVTATMGELFLRQGLYEQAVRVFERLLAKRSGDPFLAEKLETARRLTGGDAALARSSEPSSALPGEPRAAPARPGDGEGLEGAPEEPPDHAGGAIEGGSAPMSAAASTIREYLTRLVEGHGDPARPSSPRFARWLRRSDEGASRSRREEEGQA